MPTRIERCAPETLKDFYGLMDQTRDLRREAVARIWSGQPSQPSRDEMDGWADSLTTAHASLESLPGPDPDRPLRRRLLLPDGTGMDVDLDYELVELTKDALFLRQGEAALETAMAEAIPGFEEQVGQGLKHFAGLDFGAFITDRDGTVNNYCGRYRSSIQSAYNALYLARFAHARTQCPVMLTAAPLDGGGLVDVSVLPDKSFILAASKGREFLDLAGTRHREPLEPHQEKLLTELNRRLGELVSRPGHETFGLIGSGLQFKFGQSTVARQDIGQNIPADESLAFLQTIRDLVAELDPSGQVFCIEDTGLDVEIIVTVKDARSGDAERKDFDKGDAVRYLDRALGLGLNSGLPLVCGDTASDLPMLAAVMERNPETRAVFVTQKADLADRVRDICPEALIVSAPDVLVTLLGRLAKLS